MPEKENVPGKIVAPQKTASNEIAPINRPNQTKDMVAVTTPPSLVQSKKSHEKADPLPQSPKIASNTKPREDSKKRISQKIDREETSTIIVNDEASLDPKTLSSPTHNEVPTKIEPTSAPAGTIKKRLNKSKTLKIKPTQQGPLLKTEKLAKASSLKFAKVKPHHGESKTKEEGVGEPEKDKSGEEDFIKEENEVEDIPKAQDLVLQMFKSLGGENLNPEEMTKALLSDPMKAVTELMQNETIDNETKLDLYLLGNRQEQLKEHMRLLEATIEDNLMAQGDINDDLKNFFDFRVKESKGNRNELRFSQNLVLPGGRQMYPGSQSDEDDDEDDYYDDEDPEKALDKKLLNQQRRNAYRGHFASHGSYLTQELEEENKRREHFKAQMRILAKMRANNQDDKGVIQDIIKDNKNPKYKSYLLDPFDATKKKEEIPTEANKFIDLDTIKSRKMAESFRNQLMELQKNHPELLGLLLEKFGLIQSDIYSQIQELEQERATN